MVHTIDETQGWRCSPPHAPECIRGPLGVSESALTNDSIDNLAVDIGKPKVATLKPKGQSRVVDATEVHERRL